MSKYIDMPSEARYGRAVPFETGRIYYDMEGKEHVRLSNGTCVLDHSDQAAFKAAHGENGMGACVYAPSECVALRFVELTKSGEPVIGYTYRGVTDPAALQEVPAGAPTPFDLLERLKPSRRAGRV